MKEKIEEYRAIRKELEPDMYAQNPTDISRVAALILLSVSIDKAVEKTDI